MTRARALAGVASVAVAARDRMAPRSPTNAMDMRSQRDSDLQEGGREGSGARDAPPSGQSGSNSAPSTAQGGSSIVPPSPSGASGARVVSATASSLNAAASRTLAGRVDAEPPAPARRSRDGRLPPTAARARAPAGPLPLLHWTQRLAGRPQ